LYAQDLPDLVMGAVDAGGTAVDCTDLAMEGTVVATVRNEGTGAAAPFGVIFFEDSNGNGQWDDGFDLFLGGAVTAGDLAAGGETDVSALIGDTVAFAGNLIYSVADPSGAIGESDESNNTNDSGADCEFQPPPGTFDPVLEWSWTASQVMPDYLNVMMTPGVIDLNDDDVPDVVFGATSSRGGGLVEVGVLRALSGADGSELFTVTDPSFRISTTSSVAVGDIDLDGLPEILACDASGARLIAFDHDGTFKWRSPVLETINWGASSIADLDGDGTPEIVIGRQVLDNNGSVLWTGTGGRGSQGTVGPLSLVADLDLNGSPEVVAGYTAYTASGGVLWQQGISDGYNAVGDFDDDPFAEVVLVSGGSVWLLEHTGAIKWGPRSIPGGGAGGPPTIEDYDGDSEVEIGVAGASRYAVFETNGDLKWASVTQDRSSNRTGSSVFDFEGDGAAEVVYSDELTLRIYRGVDGAVLFQVPLSSCTWHEYPLVADVDADGNAEVVAVANNNCGLGNQRGIYVYGDASDSWVATRGLWNQHTYHITNISDDGTIPASEPNNWQQPALNNYRTQGLTETSPLAAPDLTASLIGFDQGPCPDNVAITARIGNGGANVAAAGVDVAFYDGATLLGVVQTTTDLDPGEFEDVEFEVSAPFEGTVCVVADDDGTGNGRVSECDETNNSCCAAISAACNRPPDVTCVDPLEVCNDVGLCSASLACDGDVATCVDPDGDATALSCVPPGPFELGLTAVTATCDDGNGATDSASCNVTVMDCDPPACTPPEDISFECTTEGGVAGDDPAIQAWLAEAEATDNCGDIATFTNDAPVLFPVNSTAVTWTATDPAGNTGECSAAVVVADTTPPTLSSVSVSPAVLWPPNHKMVSVGVEVVASDICDPQAPTCRITSITSDEPLTGCGSGKKEPDWEITGDLSAELRAERCGRRDGRVYTISISCTDADNNVSNGVALVTVPHDQGD
jgi:hypothetical protein